MEEQILSGDKRAFKQVDKIRLCHLCLRAREVSQACYSHLQKVTYYCIKTDFLKTAASLTLSQCVSLYSSYVLTFLDCTEINPFVFQRVKHFIIYVRQTILLSRPTPTPDPNLVCFEIHIEIRCIPSHDV